MTALFLKEPFAAAFGKKSPAQQTLEKMDKPKTGLVKPKSSPAKTLVKQKLICPHIGNIILFSEVDKHWNECPPGTER